MKKKFLSLMLAVCMLIGVSPMVLAANEPALTVEAAPTTVYPDSEFTVSIKIPTVDKQAYSAQFYMDFDKTNFELVEINTPVVSGVSAGKIAVNKGNELGKVTCSYYNSAGGNNIDFSNVSIVITFKAKITAALKDYNFTIDEDNSFIYFLESDGVTDIPVVGIASGLKATVSVKKAPITEVSAAVDAPVKEQALDTTVTVGADTYTGSVEWYEGAEATGTAVTGTAKDNQKYTAKITLVPANDESFATGDDLTIIAEGYTVVSKSASEIVLTKTFATDKNAAYADEITIDGDASVAVPAKDASPKTATYTAEVKDQYGEEFVGTVTWSIDGTAPTGVSIDSATGVLTVTNEAAAGTVTVKATCGNASNTKVVTITKSAAAADELTISGDATVAVPTEDASPETSTYTAEVKDQYGNEFAGTVTWSIDGTAPTGVSIDPATGVLTVTNEAAAGTVTVKATCGGASNTKVVTITKAAAAADEITIDGDATVAVPAKDASPETATYTAEVKDQYGDEFVGTVTWSIDGTAPAGVSIDPTTGVLTITNEAAAGSVTIKATCDEVSDTVDVTITKATPVATEIVITGDATAEVPAEENSPVEKTYVAEVYDQYGDEFTGTVTWSIDGTAPTGVSVDSTTGVLTITYEAVAGSVAIKATCDGASGTKSVGINKAGAVATTVTVSGVTEIAVPTEATSPATTTYTATVEDQFGDTFNSDVTWSIVGTAPTGVSINSTTGVLTVTNKAAAGTVTVKATCGEASDTVDVTITKAAPVADSVTISGANSITIPGSATYTAEVKDQYGDVITGNVVWSIEGTAPTGVSIDPTTGELTVTNNAAAGTVTVKATCGNVSATKTIQLNKRNIYPSQPGQPAHIACDICGGCIEPGCTAHDRCLLETMNFIDVQANTWYTEAVEYVYHRGLMNGIGNNLFDVSGTTTRAMIVTILYRLEGCPDVTSQNPFTDVAEGTWYTDAVIWAETEGIVNGYGDDTFGPMDPITREQMAAILYRYADFVGYGVSARADLSSYTDADKVSVWAEDAMEWAVAEGLINGTTATTLNPQGEATRAEIATILMRFCENIIERK